MKKARADGGTGRLPRGTPVVATWGYNEVTGEPFRFLYDFGYYTKYGCVVYNHGECNMQDAHAFREGEVREATEEDLRSEIWGS